MIDNLLKIILDSQLGQCRIKLHFPTLDTHYLECERESSIIGNNKYKSKIRKNIEINLKLKDLTKDNIYNALFNLDLDLRYENVDNQVILLFKKSNLEPGKEQLIELYYLDVIDINILYKEVEDENKKLKEEIKQLNKKVNSNCFCNCK